MMKEDTTYCRLREERTFLSKEKEKRDSSPSSLPSFSLSDLTIFTSYASSPSLFSPASFSLPLSSSKCSSFSLPLHPRTQIFLTRILTELPQLKLHVSSVISSSLSSSCHPGKSSRDHLSSSSSFSCSSSSSQYPSLSFHAVRSVQEKERCVLGEGDESRERRGTSFRDVPKTSSYTLEEREEKVFITAERRANRHEEKEEEKKKVKSHGDILSAVLIKIPDGLEEAIAKQRNLTKRHTRDSEESSSSSTREEREREQEKGKEKEDERVTRLHVYGGFSLRVYIHLETLLSTVGITTPWHEEREEEEEKEKKKDEEREKASSSSILDSFFSHLFLDFSLEVYSDYPFTSPSIFFHRILYREDTEHLPKGELSSSAFLPLSEKIRNLALSEIAAEDKQRRDLSAGFLRELATPSSSSRIFLSFLDQVIRHLEETLSRFSFSFPENESLTHQVLGEEWTPSLSLVLLVRRLCSFITLVYIQLSRDGAFHEKITTSSQDEEKDLPHPVHEKNTRTEKKEKEEKEEEDERSSKGMDERRRQENGICSLTQESSAPFDHAHHHKPWRDSHLQENFSSDSSSSFSSSSPPYPSSSCLSCTSSPCLSFRERRRRRCPMICRLVRSSWRMRGACILFVWLAGVLLRASVGLYPYSGEGEIKTGYGDFEAQRHWMEIAFNLPISTWYTYGTCHHDDFHDDQPRHSHSVHHTNHTDSSSSSPYSSSSLSSSSSVAVSRHPKVVWWPLDYPPLSAFLAQFFSFFSFLSYPPSVLFWTWRLPPEEIKGKDISEGGIDIKKLTNGTSGNLVSSSSSSSPSYPSSSSSHLTSSSLSSLSPSFPASSSSSSSSSFSWLAEGLHYSSSSRGVEDSFFRVFMRWSVIACDLLLFFSLLFFFSSPRTLSEKREMKRKTERHPSTSRTFVSLHKEAFSVSSFFLGEERPPKERTDGQQQQEEERREFQSRGLDQRRSAESEEKEKKESPWKEEETDDERIGAKEKEKERRDTLFPSSSSFFSCGCPPEAKAILLPLILCFFSPPLLLVDHLHFQYNNVALSLVITAAAFILRHRDYLASI
ncbi:alg8 glycosyltransferase family protein, partial [Cystoisospora suis]